MESPLTAKAAILQVLMDGEAFGLEIAERVRERTEGKIELGPGSLYPALKGLERSGLLESWNGPPLEQRGGRPRRYYKLTADGVRAAHGQRASILQLLRLSLGGLFGAAGGGR